MTDKELLELAAKAAGINLDEISKKYKDDWAEIWNPLTDDGDALRLAVKLNINLDFSLGGGFVCAGGVLEGVEEDASNDPNAATRRAIVRAAAEIGKSHD